MFPKLGRGLGMRLARYNITTRQDVYTDSNTMSAAKLIPIPGTYSSGMF